MAEGCFFYYITDRTAFATDEPTRRRWLLEKIDEAARAGVDYVQLREKDLPIRELESLAREAVALMHKATTANPGLRTALLINSRTDVALATGADGVHLRSYDVSPHEARSIWGTRNVRTVARASRRNAVVEAASGAPPRSPLIGISCHSPEEVQNAAHDCATFAVFAPVFEKKDSPGIVPAGLKGLEEACRAPIPVLALGGINLENAAACLEVGAAGIAAIRLFQENDIASIVRRLRG
jgi:thiamine-phosphate pyrophosphorylase